MLVNTKDGSGSGTRGFGGKGSKSSSQKWNSGRSAANLDCHEMSPSVYNRHAFSNEGVTSRKGGENTNIGVKEVSILTKRAEFYYMLLYEAYQETDYKEL